MCGIFGYVGAKNSAPQIVLEGLKCLEYRGYDSWGVGFARNGQIEIKKKIGKIGNNSLALHNSDFAFGHTRWATHGGVTDVNAHPHKDCTGKIAVVHNGIIENYQEIKSSLKTSHKFLSETDTEVFAHLVEELKEKYGLKEAVRLAFLKLNGLSAFLVAETDSKRIVAVKNGSPLVIGLGNSENLIASDVNSLLSETKKVIFLEDLQLAEISKDYVKIFEVEKDRKINPKVETISWEQIKAEKKDFPDFMIKEINEEPKVLENILLNFEEKIVNFSKLINDYDRVYLIGCGTAYLASLFGSYIFSKFGKNIEAISGSEFSYKEQFLNKTSLVIFLSQSGETIDIIEPLKKIQKKGIKTAALVNVFGSTLYRLAEEKIWLEAGPEIAVVSTKAFLAKVAILGLCAFALGNKIEVGKKHLEEAIKALEQATSAEFNSKLIDPLVEKLKNKEHIYVIGRGLSYPIALEAALKLKETAYIHTEAFSGGELKHGPIALIEKRTPCIVFAPEDETYESVISNAMEIKARGGYIIGISSREESAFDYFIRVKEAGEFSSIANVAVAQLLAYKIAKKLGLDPDKPRNLAKSVTVK